jgi:cell division protein FtsQ
MPAVGRGAPKGAAGSKGRGRATPPPPPPGRGPVRGGVGPGVVLGATAALLGGGALVLLATGGRAHAFQARLHDDVAEGFARAGFRVSNVVVEGASRFSVPYVVKAAGIAQGAPLMGFDLADVRRRVEQVGWVKSVRILRLLPDTVVLAVSERPRLAVWQADGASHVIDPDGQTIPEADPGLFVDLPLVVGAGAPQAAGALLPELQARPHLMSKLEAAVRVDDRRWDLRLKDGGLIQLPAVDQDGALIELDQLDQKDRLLDLGFERVDLRDPDMVVVRPRAPPAATAQAASGPATSGPTIANSAAPTPAAAAAPNKT